MSVSVVTNCWCVCQHWRQSHPQSCTWTSQTWRCWTRWCWRRAVTSTPASASASCQVEVGPGSTHFWQQWQRRPAARPPLRRLKATLTRSRCWKWWGRKGRRISAVSWYKWLRTGVRRTGATPGGKAAGRSRGKMQTSKNFCGRVSSAPTSFLGRWLPWTTWQWRMRRRCPTASSARWGSSASTACGCSPPPSSSTSTSGPSTAPTLPARATRSTLRRWGVTIASSVLSVLVTERWPTSTSFGLT